jgi:hypothetical protein
MVVVEGGREGGAAARPELGLSVQAAGGGGGRGGFEPTAKKIRVWGGPPPLEYLQRQPKILTTM